MPLPHAYTYPCIVQLRRRVCQASQPISSAKCLMNGAAHELQRAPTHPAPPQPAGNVDMGAPNDAPSAHATRLVQVPLER